MISSCIREVQVEYWEKVIFQRSDWALEQAAQGRGCVTVPGGVQERY